MEFKDVMAESIRLCNYYARCTECPLYNKHTNSDSFCFFDAMLNEDINFDEAEKNVMAWAEQHPTPLYPSWGEWIIENFHSDYTNFCPSVFGAPCDRNCELCRKRPIPEQIAKKLNIKPIGETK